MSIRYAINYKVTKVLFALLLIYAGTVAQFQKDISVGQSASNNVVIDAKVLTPDGGPSIIPGDELSWQKSVDTSQVTEKTDGVFIETINQGQKFAGNLQLPRGWNAEYSTSPIGTPLGSRTWESFDTTDGAYTSQELAAMNYLRIDTGITETLKPSARAPILQPLEPRKLDHADEGNLASIPILYKDKIFFVYRGIRSAADINNFDCFDLIAYERCAGFPTHVSSIGASSENQTALGTGTSDISTPYNFQVVLDTELDRNEGWMYFPGQRANDYGVVCVNLNTLSNCGFTVMGSYPQPAVNPSKSNQNPTVISGFVQSGDRIYGHANDRDKTSQTILCFDIRQQAICPNYDANTVSTNSFTYYQEEHGNSYDTPGSHVVVGEKIYWNVNYRAGNSRIIGVYADTQRDLGTRIYCFNVTTRQACSGWVRPILYASGAGLERPFSLFPWHQTDGTVTEICISTGLGNGIDPAQRCYDISTGAVQSTQNKSLNPPQWLTTPWTFGPNTVDIVDENGDLRTYFPVYKTGSNTNLTATQINLPPTKGGTICYNWTQEEFCEFFGDRESGSTLNGDGSRTRFYIHKGIRYWHEINLGQGGDTGYVYDGSCMWGMGHAGYIWSFDPMTGDTPCRVARVKDSVTINQADYYCDGQDRILNWDKARLSRARLYDFQNFNIKISNATDTDVLVEEDIKLLQQGTLDLDIPYGEHQELRLDMLAKLYNTTPWGNDNTPYLSLIADTESAQYCYDTVVPPQNCDVSSVVTSSSATLTTETDTLTNSTDEAVTVVPEPDKQCFKDLKVEVRTDSATIRENEDITYELVIQNKANVDPERRGDITGATYRVDIPDGFSYVSSTDGGAKVGRTVVWNNQSIDAGQTVRPTVTFRVVPGVVSSESVPQNSLFMGTAFALEQQSTAVVNAEVEYNGDVFTDDNTTTNTGVVVIRDIPDPEVPDDTDPPVDDEDPETPPVDEDPVTEPPVNTDTEEQITDPITGEPIVVTDTNSNTQTYTPKILESIVPEPIKKQVELVFSTLNKVVTPIPKGVAIALPYIAISFLAVFALTYVFLVSTERENKRKLKKLKKRFEQTEQSRKDYINIVSHYLNTPIATMKLTLETTKLTPKLTKDVMAKVTNRIEDIVKHTSALIMQNDTKDSSMSTQTILSKPGKNLFLSFDLLATIVGVLIIAVVLNLVFVWSGKYSVTAPLVVSQSAYFALTLGLLATAYNSFKHTRYANAVVQQELQYEQELAATQSRFIANASRVLSDDIAELDEFTPLITSSPKTKPYDQSIRSLKDIVGRLMAINSLVTRQRLSTIVQEDMSVLVEDVIKELRPEAEKRSIELAMYLASNLNTTIDANDIQNILSPVIDNAIKFNDDGGSVDVILRRKNETFANIIVKDTGSGIPKDKLETLFAPFSRATGTLEYDYEGVGLALYTVKLTVEHYGGSIRINSEEGKGTTVYIELPLL